MSVRNPHYMDREATPIMHLVVEASTGAQFDYAHIMVTLQDENDNKPYFIQDYLQAWVYEGSLKATFVAKARLNFITVH